MRQRKLLVGFWLSAVSGVVTFLWNLISGLQTAEQLVTDAPAIVRAMAWLWAEHWIGPMLMIVAAVCLVLYRRAEVATPQPTETLSPDVPGQPNTEPNYTIGEHEPLDKERRTYITFESARRTLNTARTLATHERDAAVEWLRGRSVQLTGTAQGISNKAGRWAFNIVVPWDDGGSRHFTCHFAARFGHRISQLEPGATVTVEGVIFRPSLGYSFTLVRCELVE